MTSSLTNLDLGYPFIYDNLIMYSTLVSTMCFASEYDFWYEYLCILYFPVVYL